MLELKKVSKIYTMGGGEVKALDGLDLKVEQGECIAVMGPSGSGKSTLLHVLGFLDRPSSGEYLYQGKHAEQFSDRELSLIRNREIGFVFQSFNLLTEETALRNVSLPLLYARAVDPMARAAVALEKVGLAARADHRPFALSGGEQQRVAIARALVKEPHLILADEPTGNLDTVAGNAIMDLLLGLNRAGITIVLITHDDAVAAMTQRTLRLVDGRFEKV
ncbi:MAG: ABC transporter ATP-binding protein [Planctomycetota bacterium]